MSRALDDLDVRLRAKAFEHIARCAERGIAVFIVDTIRTIEEQRVNVAKGVSWTLHSKHLPQPQSQPPGKAWAYDLVPYAQYNLHGPDKAEWAEDDPAWAIIGEIGHALGLKWGVLQRGIRLDLGHFEWDGA